MLDLLEFLAQLIAGSLIVAVAAPLVVLAGFVSAFYLAGLLSRAARPATIAGAVGDADLDAAEAPAKPPLLFGVLDGEIGYHDPCNPRFAVLVDARLLGDQR